MRRVLIVGLLVMLSVSAAASGAAAEPATAEPADLNIQQPHYVDGDVALNTSGPIPVYRVDGARQYVTPENFNQSGVLEYGVTTAGATLTRNQDLGVYQFQADSPGTYEVYWTVLEQREVSQTNNSTTTEQVQVTYRAHIRVQTVDYQHLPAGELQQVREDAANWTAFVGAVKSDKIAGPGADMAAQTQLAINLLRLRHHPWAALTGNFTEILIILGTTLGGFIVLTLWLGWHWWQRRKDLRERRKQHDLDAERADLEEQLDEVQLHERLLKLEGMDWNDLFDDATARAFRDAFGETVLDGWLRINEVLSPRAVVTDRVGAMSDEYVVTADGDPMADDTPADLKLHRVDESPEDAEVYTFGAGDDADLDVEAVVQAVDWDDSELRSFDLVNGGDVDVVSIEGASLDELIEEYDVAMEQDFDGDRELFAEYLHEFLRAIEDHRITDEEGRPKSIRVAMNAFLRAARVLRDREEVPLANYQAEHTELLLEREDQERDIQQYVTDIQEGRV